MSQGGPIEPTATEEAAAAPGWVEPALDRVLAPVSGREGVAPLRGAWLDGIAAAGPGSDLESLHATCTAALLKGLERIGVDPGTRDGIERGLQALSAEIAQAS